MAVAATDVAQMLLNDPSNPEVVHRLAAPDATHVSPNGANPDLKRIGPWVGTRAGPQAVLGTHARVNRRWHSEASGIGELFGQGGDVAVCGGVAP